MQELSFSQIEKIPSRSGYFLSDRLILCVRILIRGVFYGFRDDDLLQLILDEGGSDLHIQVGVPPTIRMGGHMVSLDTAPLTPDDTESLMKAITAPANQQKIRTNGGCDFGFAFGTAARFRVSVLKAKGNIGMVLRVIPNDLLTLEQIGLPPIIKDILFRPRGMCLVTGPTGSGKFTTLASMINIINHERNDHIITIEEPIEFYHPHKKCAVTQREVHVDVPSFADALRGALRQYPDIILVGEMRDLETIESAVTAAEKDILSLVLFIQLERQKQLIVLLMHFRQTNRNRSEHSWPIRLSRLFHRFCVRDMISRVVSQLMK